MFNWIKRAFDWTTGKIDSTIASWVNTVIHGIWSFLTSLFDDVIGAWNLYYNAVRSFVHGVTSLASECYHWFTWWLRVQWSGWIAWFRKYIEAPLHDAYNWITHEGVTVWHYLTHADDLVAWFFDSLVNKIETEAWGIGEKLGEFFMSLIIKNVARFATLVEDIIEAIF